MCANRTGTEDPAVTIRRLRQRLYVVEPVFRAAIALYRNDARQTVEARDRLERAVDRALDTQSWIALGGSISDDDLEEIPLINDRHCRCYLPLPCSFLGICRKCGCALPHFPPRPRWCTRPQDLFKRGQA